MLLVADNMNFEAAAMTEPVACIVHAFETTWIINSHASHVFTKIFLSFLAILAMPACNIGIYHNMVSSFK